MLNLNYELSDISRTNQIHIHDTSTDLAEKLYQYLRKQGKGIDSFRTRDIPHPASGGHKIDYANRDSIIREEVRKRLVAAGQLSAEIDVQYSLCDSGGETYVFFLTSDTRHSAWKSFIENDRSREKIFSLVFKFHLISRHLPFDTINGFEEILLVYSQHYSPLKDKLYVWGQSVVINYNKHGVLTINLNRTKRQFLRSDAYKTADGEGLGDIMITPKGSKSYYFHKRLDGRKKNKIDFVRFDSKDDDLHKFRTTQLYYYQRLMNELGAFLEQCEISYSESLFQANAYLEKPFIDHHTLEAARALKTLCVINNTGYNFSGAEMNFMRNFFAYQGVEQVNFFASGRTVSEYEAVPDESDDEDCWKIYEAIPWISVRLKPDENYLVFNRELDDEDAGSMAYQRSEDGLWISSAEIEGQEMVDFYTNLKRRYGYLACGAFFCMQGVNVKRFVSVGDDNLDDLMVLRYDPAKIDPDALSADCRPMIGGSFLDSLGNINAYLSQQTDVGAWQAFLDRYKIKISPEFQKILSELGIKSWIRKGLIDHQAGLPIQPQQFQEHAFWVLYVRSPRRGEAKAVAVEFLYREGKIYIKGVLSGAQEVRRRFPFVRSGPGKSGASEGKLYDDQQYFVDEQARIHITCWTKPAFTPILIGRPRLLEDLEQGILKIDRKNKGESASRILPLVIYYNPTTLPINRIQNRICLDLKNGKFIQYYVPPKSGLANAVKRGFRVYHLYGYTYDGVPLSTETLINHPIVALHFNTLTQNILRIGENSQSSLLQKVVRVLIEN